MLAVVPSHKLLSTCELLACKLGVLIMQSLSIEPTRAHYTPNILAKVVSELLLT